MFVLEYRRDEARRTTFGSLFGAMRSRQESHCHVATSPRRDVTKSRRGGQLNRSQPFTTSRRPHVATSPRRDVSSKICISSLNARGLGILGHRRTCGQRHEFGEPATLTLRIFLDFCIGFSYCLIIVGSHEDIFHITYCVSFFHDVLSLFLGLHQTLLQTMD